MITFARTFQIYFWKKDDDQSGCSVARSSRLLWEQEVAGSNPATPTKNHLLLVDGFLTKGLTHLTRVK